jgi:cell shape-determining protein MreC
MSFPITLFLSLLLFLSNFQNNTKNLSSYLHRLSSPISIPVSKVKTNINNSLNFVRSIPSLTRQLKNLELQNRELLVQVNALTSKVSELDTFKSIPKSNLSIQPVSLLTTSTVNTLFTTNPSVLKTGQAVADNNSLLGLIKEVFSHTATLYTMTDSNITIPIITSNGLTGSYSVKQSVPTITIYDNTKELPLGTAVFTAGNEDLPKNLLIGKVIKILSKISDTSGLAQIELATNPNAALQPYVITNF